MTRRTPKFRVFFPDRCHLATFTRAFDAALFLKFYPNATVVWSHNQIRYILWRGEYACAADVNHPEYLARKLNEALDSKRKRGDRRRGPAQQGGDWETNIEW